MKVATGDYGRLRRLVRYLARPAVSVERVSYDQAGGTVTVRSSKIVHGVRPVVAQYDALTFLSLLALQVPPPGVKPGSLLRPLFGQEPGGERAAAPSVGVESVQRPRHVFCAVTSPVVT